MCVFRTVAGSVCLPRQDIPFEWKQLSNGIRGAWSSIEVYFSAACKCYARIRDVVAFIFIKYIVAKRGECGAIDIDNDHRERDVRVEFKLKSICDMEPRTTFDCDGTERSQADQWKKRDKKNVLINAAQFGSLSSFIVIINNKHTKNKSRHSHQ